METIGERLEEARKRKGISIREAAEVTKIRSDYLSSFENNDFDINLPEIYIRGFLRTYSNFLKLNPDKVVTDYNAHLFGAGKNVRKDPREFFGRIELPDRENPERKAEPAHEAPMHSDTESREEGEKPSLFASVDQAQVLKIGTIAGGGLVVLLLLVFLVRAVISPDPADPARVAEAPAATNSQRNNASTDEINLIAEGDVIVRVVQQRDGEVLFAGPIARGETVRVVKEGPVRISWTDGNNLRFERNGERSRPSAGGMGQDVFQ